VWNLDLSALDGNAYEALKAPVRDVSGVDKSLNYERGN
jgi:hypothetical protein